VDLARLHGSNHKLHGLVFKSMLPPDNTCMKIKMKVNGREVGSAGSLDLLVLDQVKRTMQEKVAGLTCSEHRMPAVIQVNGESLAGLKVQIQACCDTMRQRVSKALV
jgi:hypothetical protein